MNQHVKTVVNIWRGVKWYYRQQFGGRIPNSFKVGGTQKSVELGCM